jgi:hypothetical protein
MLLTNQNIFGIPWTDSLDILKSKTYIVDVSIAIKEE